MPARILVAGLTLALAIVAQLPAAAQTAAGKVQELTALDYFQIQQLVVKYARAIDTCSNNGYDYADLFTPDGSFVPEANGMLKAQNLSPA